MFSIHVCFYFGLTCCRLQDIGSFLLKSVNRWKLSISDIFLHHFIWSDYTDFAPDIDFPFFIMTQGICLNRNVLFLGMFGDFMDQIACIVLR